MDEVTKRWIRNVSDERAVENGCHFNEEQGEFVCSWIEKYLKLYEGEWAGQPMKLLPWAYECTMRLFGWMKYSEKWGRDIRRFRQASIWCAKKQGKSPWLAAIALYLLCGDSEQGQKVFLGAKDGMQARKIAGEHAVQMLFQSPDLMNECTLNRSTMRITHLPSKSWLEPLSSSNSRTQESKEGLNGSVLFDETHILDRDFVRRVSRAGISRAEPLQIEVSTAGNNPDGYGCERFKYAQSIENGEATDQELFVAIYAAPQDLTDEQLEEDPLRYGKMANPAMGHTVDPEEYLSDYRKSKATIQGLLDFKMYRLNIWQRSSNPAIKRGDWLACAREFTEDDFLGRDCWAGLDLARTRDMSALVLVFKGDGDEEYDILPYFWLPRKRAEELASLCAIREWERGGFLTVTEGPVTDYNSIKSKFRELAEKFNIKELAYDPKFGEEVTQNLSEGSLDAAGNVLEAGTGIERFVFIQNDVSFAAPTADFERLILAGKLHHNNHPVLTWQVGHVHFLIRQNKVKRFVKEKATSHLTIDGVIGAVMGLARAMLAKTADWYSPGMLHD